MWPLPFAWIRTWHALTIAVGLSFILPLLSGELVSIETLIPSIMLFVFLFPFLLAVGAWERREKISRERNLAKQEYLETLAYKFGLALGLLLGLEDDDFSIHYGEHTETPTRIISTLPESKHAIVCERLVSLGVLKRISSETSEPHIAEQTNLYEVFHLNNDMYRALIAIAADIRRGTGDLVYRLI